MILFKATKTIKKGEWLVCIYDKDIKEFAFNEDIGVDVEKWNPAMAVNILSMKAIPMLGYAQDI